MAKKKKAEEHENLERWLVSYADFMTLLFATFVVLFGLAQTDVNTLQDYAIALKESFEFKTFNSKETIIDGSESFFEGKEGTTNPLMLEYMSQKYEQTSYEEIKGDIESLKEDGISAQIDERGLVIKFSEKAIKFVPGSAELQADSIKKINEVAKIIKRKFSIHYIRVEGHTDSDKLSNSKYPSNWELSSARASAVVRFMINSGFNSKLFSAVGLADTVPVAPNTTFENKAKNRRVEIIVLKNKHKDLSKKDIQKIMKEIQEQRKNKIIRRNHPQAVEEIMGKDKELLENVIDMKNQYSDETERLNLMQEEDYIFDGQKPYFADK